MNNTDEVYIAIDILMESNCWEFLNECFSNLDLKVWRTDIDTLLAYATASLPGKSKIPSRVGFINTCKRFHPDVTLWVGLE